MSDPMSTVEIEDVLSSIRRLVSEDLRPTHKLVSAALKNGASKLILTPALRIVPDERMAPPGHLDDFEDDRDAAPVPLDPDVEDQGQTAEILPVFGSVRLHEHLDKGERHWQPREDAAASDANFLATAMSRINGLAGGEPEPVAKGHSDTIEAVVAVVGAAVGPDEWEVDGGDPAPQAAAWGNTVWNTADDAVMPSSGGSDVLRLETPVSVAVVDDGGDALPHDLQSETLVQQQVTETEAGLVGADSIVFNDDIVSRAEDAGPITPVADLDADDPDETDDFLNEDILREIVRDMIREELQGTLGERITRNVRKLVRAEINRALVAHDYGDRASRA